MMFSGRRNQLLDSDESVRLSQADILKPSPTPADIEVRFDHPQTIMHPILAFSLDLLWDKLVGDPGDPGDWTPEICREKVKTCQKNHERDHILRKNPVPGDFRVPKASGCLIHGHV